MTGSNLWMLLAVLLAPLAAVQLSMWRERVRRADDRRLSIFQTLMSTRTQRLGWPHISALNMIDVEFYGKGKFEAVRGAWHSYLANLASPQSEAMSIERDRLFYELLQKMGIALGYTFEITSIKQTAYIPQWHTDFEKDQAVIRAGVVGVLSGKLSIPVQVVESQPPGHAEAVQALKGSEPCDPPHPVTAEPPVL